jgi:hypothetical protein
LKAQEEAKVEAAKAEEKAKFDKEKAEFEIRIKELEAKIAEQPKRETSQYGLQNKFEASEEVDKRIKEIDADKNLSVTEKLAKKHIAKYYNR